MFKNVQIRFQTARSLPAPYAYFFTLTARPAEKDQLAVDLKVTYPDREDIDEDELIAEGYTRDDDYAWSGLLGRVWLDTLDALVRQTKLKPLNEDELEEDDDFWEVDLTAVDGNRTAGIPQNYEQWQYITQELMQATYELAGRERPFEVTYLEPGRAGEEEIHLTASFAGRNVTVEVIKNRQSEIKTLPWNALHSLMSTLFEIDFDETQAESKRPKRDGAWVNLGTEGWYDVGPYEPIVELFRAMR